jgi:hypothetical protein
VHSTHNVTTNSQSLTEPRHHADPKSGPSPKPTSRSRTPETLDTPVLLDLRPGKRGEARTSIYLLVGDLGLVGEDEVDGELGGDGRRRRRAWLHQRDGRLRGLDVGGHLVPRLHERGVVRGLRGHLRRGERPAGGEGGAGGEAAGGVAQHFCRFCFGFSYAFSLLAAPADWVGGYGDLIWRVEGRVPEEEGVGDWRRRGWAVVTVWAGLGA